MDLKRVRRREGEEEGEGSLGRESKRQRSFLNCMREVMGIQCMQRQLPKLEPFLRGVVQDEVQNALHSYLHFDPRAPISQIQAAVSKRYELRFLSSLPQTLFTGSRIEAEGKKVVEIALFDTDLNQIIRSCLSPIKVKVLVLDGDFCADGQLEWTEKEFDDSIVREREGKRPLLTGERVITLSNGVGCLVDATFTDNSSWIRSRKFRLGAKVLQSQCIEERVKEAISEAFLVKDHRGELYQKHHPPSLGDDVWRLEKIGKDGVFHKRLMDDKINTVQDFLRNLVMNQGRLRKLLGSGMSNKMWEITINHARECLLDDKHYSYDGGQGVVLLFNSIYQLVGALFNQNYHHIDKLSASQKVLVDKLKQVAYTFPDLIVEFNEQLVDNCSRLSSTSGAITNPVSSWLEQQNPNLPATDQDDSASQVCFLHPPHHFGNELKEDISHIDIFTGHGSHMVQHFGSFRMNSFNTSDFCDMQFGNVQTSGLAGPIMTSEHPTGYNCEAHMPVSSPFPGLWDLGSGFFQASGGETGGSFPVHVPCVHACVASRKWAKVIAVSKWMAVSRRCAERRARINVSDYLTLPASLSTNAPGRPLRFHTTDLTNVMEAMGGSMHDMEWG